MSKNKHLMFRIVFVLMAAFIWAVNASAAVRYVDVTRPSEGSGATWATAFKTLAAAMTTGPAPAATEFWVAQGTYTPASLTTPMITLNQYVVYGGFATPVAGVGATVNTDRDWKTYPTIYSGDTIGNDGVSDIVINDNATTERSFFLANSAGIVLDGFTFQYGRSQSTNTRHGGVLYVTGSANTTIRHCKFLNNLGQRGGAVGGEAGSFNITVEDCLFWGNQVQTLTDPPLSAYGAQAVTDNMPFGGFGPAIANRGISGLGILTVRNSTFGGNLRLGSTTGLDIDIASAAGATSFKNCIVWSSDSPISFSAVVPTITYSDIRQASGTYAGTGNINADPLFVSLATGDLQLRSAPSFSPCMDVAPDPLAGSTKDVAGLTRPIDGKANGSVGTEYDMGAYETQFKYGCIASVGNSGGTIQSPSVVETLPGGSVTFTAIPYTDFEVDHWEDPLGNTVQSGNSTTYTINPVNSHHLTVTVFFKTTVPGYEVTVNATPTVSNLEFKVAATTYYGTTPPFVWDGGTSHTLEATPTTQYFAGNRYLFANWLRSEGGTSTDNPYTYVTASGPGPYTVTAQFNTEYSLTITNGTGGASVTPGTGPFYYAPNTVVPITATATTPTYAFVNWTGASVADVADPNSASTTITMTSPGNKSITANFRRVVYVDASRVSEGSGVSWANAYKTLWNALKTESTAGQEYWVAQGTYIPDSLTTPMVTLQSDVVYGGFATPVSGVGATSRTDRNWTNYPAIVTGDTIGGDGVSDIVINDNATTERSFFLADTAGIVLDGFTFQYGRSLSTNTRHGGALYVAAGSTTIRNCKFLNNLGQRGGAIGAEGGTYTLTVENCLFWGNKTQSDLEYPQNPATFGVGAVAGQTAFVGPAIANRGSGSSSVMNILNCSFAGNSRPNPATPTGWDLDLATNTIGIIKNSIVWSSNDPVSYSGGPDPTMTYSDVRQASGTYPGASNINSDPNFLSLGTGDLHLVSPSPCLEAGNNTGISSLDLDVTARLKDALVDMGAYEKATSSTADLTVNDSPNGGAFDVTITGPSVGTQNGTTDFTLSAIGQGTIALSATSPKTISATSRYAFQKWNDGTTDSFSNPLTGYNFDGNKTFTLSYVVQYLCSATTIPASGAGSVTMSPVDGWVTDGANIQFTANPSAPFTFSHWTIGGITQPDGAVMVRAVSGAPVVAVAVFTCGDNSVTVQTSPSGRTYTADGDTQTVPKTYCWSTSSRTVSTPAVQTIVAGQSEYRFVEWSDGVGTYGTASINYPVVATRTLEATFDAYYKLTVSAPSGGTLSYAPSLPGDAYYIDGQVVTVTATPSPGYSLAAWSGTATVGATIIGNDITFTMDAAKTLAVTFKQVLRVDKDSVAGSPDGLSWATAYPTLQAGLTAATAGMEIWVADGTYRPGSLTSDRFNMKTGVAVYGGFAATETTRLARSWKYNATILSGDLSQNDLPNWGNRGDNAINVVYAAPSVTGFVLDGFTVRAGDGLSAAANLGNGAGMFIGQSAAGEVANCNFTGNRADTGDGYGGGMYPYRVAGVQVINCVFYANRAWRGGGLGAVQAVGQTESSDFSLINCTIVSNVIADVGVDDRGGGVYNQFIGAPAWYFKNTIIWDNKRDDNVVENLRLRETHARTENSTYGLGTSGAVTYDVNLNAQIDVDPLLADASTGNLHLKVASPCKDTGTATGAPTVDIEGRTRPKDAGVDRGAYEYAVDYTATYTAGANGSIAGPNPQTIAAGDDGLQVIATPSAHYHFLNWSDAYPTAARTDLDVVGNITATANFEVDQHTLTYNAGANGSIVGTTPQTVNYGGNGSLVTATPAANYHFVSWSDGYPTAARTDLSITGDITVTANFAIDQYTLTYNAGLNGSIVGTTPQTVNHGANGSLVTATPAANYHFVSWSDGYPTAARTDLTVTGNITATANFAIDQYTLTYNAGANGSIVGTTPQTVNYGGNGSLVTATPVANYHFVSWSDGYPTAARTDLSITGNITVTANFAIDQYTLTYNAGINGSIVGTTPQTVNHGSNGSLVTATGSAGYHFLSWSDAYPTAARTDLNVTANKTVTATFEVDAAALPPATVLKFQ